MIRIIYIIIALTAIITACTENEITPAAETDIPVVEAYLNPGQDVSVYLSKMVPYIIENIDTTQLTIDSADVYIQHNDSEYLLEHVNEVPGKYFCPDSILSITPGEEYKLYFNYRGNTVSAITSIPDKPVETGLNPGVLQINPNNMRPGMTQNKVTVYWENPDNDYHLIVTEYMESSYDPITPNLDPEIYDQYRIVSTKPVMDYSYDLDTRRQLLFFGTYRVIIYKVNEEYVNLYENISQNSLSLTEPLTNIENGLGIFTGINSDTLMLEIEKIWW